MNTGEGWRGMGSNDELNIYMYILYVVQLFTFLFKAAAAVATAAYWCGPDTKDADLWKWTFTHRPSRRCHIRVSSDCSVWGMPFLKRRVEKKYNIYIYIYIYIYIMQYFMKKIIIYFDQIVSYLSIDCTTLTYAMAAASSPRRWTYGLTMLTLVLLLRSGFTENN